MVGIEVILFSGAFFMMICFMCFTAVIYQIRYTKKRDEYYEKQIKEITKAIQQSNIAERDLIKEINDLTQTLRKK